MCSVHACVPGWPACLRDVRDVRACEVYAYSHGARVTCAVSSNTHRSDNRATVILLFIKIKYAATASRMYAWISVNYVDINLGDDASSSSSTQLSFRRLSVLWTSYVFTFIHPVFRLVCLSLSQRCKVARMQNTFAGNSQIESLCPDRLRFILLKTQFYKHNLLCSNLCEHNQAMSH